MTSLERREKSYKPRDWENAIKTGSLSTKPGVSRQNRESLDKTGSLSTKPGELTGLPFSDSVEVNEKNCHYMKITVNRPMQ